MRGEHEEHGFASDAALMIKLLIIYTPNWGSDYLLIFDLWRAVKTLLLGVRHLGESANAKRANRCNVGVNVSFRYPGTVGYEFHNNEQIVRIV